MRGPQKANAMRAAMLDIEAEVDEQEQNDQADPVVERHRNGRQPEFVHKRSNDAEDLSMHGGLGNEMADSDQQRHAGIFPRIVTLPVENDQSLQHGHDQK